LKILQQAEKTYMQSLKIDPSKINGFNILEERLFEQFSDVEGITREICGYLMDAAGKRIRPQLILHSGLTFSHVNDDLLNAAIAAELIHMASLVHDDVIDESSLRRSKPSINIVWDNNCAVLCGDYLFAKAFSILADRKLSTALGLMVEAIQSMCQGELEQANDKFNYTIDIDKYYTRIARKTAIFLQCCCKAGAAIGGASENQINSIGDYGLNLGFAFQIIDDILDFCGDVEAMGKPIGEDLSQGNITLPVLLLLQNKSYGNWIKNLIIEREFSKDNIKKICEVLKESGAIEEAYMIASEHIQKAKECLNLLPESEDTAFLYELTDMLESRMN